MKIPAEFNDIKEIKKIFSGIGRTVGVGVSAFQRSGLGYILPNYEILSLLATSDLEAIRQVCPVTVIGGREKPEKLNTSSILKLKWVKKWINQQSGVSVANLFVYKAATPLDEIIKSLPVRLLSAPGYIRKPLEDKKVFRKEAAKAGVSIPRGENLPLEELTEKKWDNLKQQYGGRLVFQLTDYSTGGGQGTFFVDCRRDWDRFWEFTRSQDRKKELRLVNVCPYVTGRTASITGCATKYGVIGGVLQTQIMDQPELAGFKGRNGVWLGHDWTVSFSKNAQENAEAECRKWGEHIYRLGYKGIFGLDVIVGSDEQVTVIECNSRYTGAFPVYTMLQLSRGEMPLDVWHLAEWLGLDYETDIRAVQAVSRQAKNGSHLILHSLEPGLAQPRRPVKAGVYSSTPQPVRRAQSLATPLEASSCVSPDILRASVADGANVKYIRPGFSLLDIKDSDEFVLCDRVPDQGQTVKPGERVGKLIFKRRIIDNNGRLLPEIRELVRQVYQNLDLVFKSS